jgi:hypothetical protein
MCVCVCMNVCLCVYESVFVQWRTQDFFFHVRASTNSVEDRGQREWGSGDGSPLVRGSTQFVND